MTLSGFRTDMSLRANRLAADLWVAVKERSILLIVLALIALAAYGFELFNLNLTIDEEVHATYADATLAWVEQGRWAMYLLNRLLLPHTVIPFVPLFLALVFEIAALVLLLHAWGIKSRSVQILAGAVALAFPGMAFIYAFSTINYGIGVGLFCVALSLVIYVHTSNAKRLLAAIPAGFAIGIYQGFLPALSAVFLVYLIVTWRRSGRLPLNELLPIAVIHILAALGYYVVQKTVFGTVAQSGYISSFFDISYLLAHKRLVVSSLVRRFVDVYGGAKSIYSIRIEVLGILLLGSGLVFLFGLVRDKRIAWISKIGLAGLVVVLVGLPFASGLLTRGVVWMHVQVGLPVVVAGLVAMGLGENARLPKVLLALLAGWCVFQSIVAINRLSAASYLALQADRLLASRLISRIEAAEAEHGGSKPRYLEMVGYPNRPVTELMPKLETIGASFFEWDEGNPARVVLFLQTIGYSELLRLPDNQRLRMLDDGQAMPVWPQTGSVRIVDDTVLVKFGDYSTTQKQIICAASLGDYPSPYQAFCN